jgi:alpha-galactosidase/6-phospho-beta-glucosidase family protein
MKIVLIGAGSYVFGPSILKQAIVDNQLEDVELALMDIDSEIVTRMAGVAQRMLAEYNRQEAITVTAHTTWDSALPGADFVICAVAIQGQKRFEQDVEIIRQYIPDHLVTEFGGIAGTSYSLRQIAMITQLTDAMKLHSPAAWLMNVANPLPRVSQAAHENGIKTIGFCSVAQEVHGRLWELWHGETAPYPFAIPRNDWEIVTAGVNHLSWVLTFRDRATGADLYPELRQRLSESSGETGQPQSEMLLRETGYLLSASDHHIRDFLEPFPGQPEHYEVFHGTPVERQARLNLLDAIGAGDEPWERMMTAIAWERPIDVIAAMQTNEPVVVEALNLVNTGQMPALPNGVFVETPVWVSADGIRPETVQLPDSVQDITRRTALISDTIVRGAINHDRSLIHRAIELDPTVIDKAAGIRAIDACISAHDDLIGEWK